MYVCMYYISYILLKCMYIRGSRVILPVTANTRWQYYRYLYNYHDTQRELQGITYFKVIMSCKIYIYIYIYTCIIILL